MISQAGLCVPKTKSGGTYDEVRPEWDVISGPTELNRALYGRIFVEGSVSWGFL